MVQGGGHFNPSPNYFSKNVANSYKSIPLYCQSSGKPHSWGYERAEAVTLLFHLHTNCHPRSKHIVNIMDYINLVLFVDIFLFKEREKLGCLVIKMLYIRASTLTNICVILCAARSSKSREDSGLDILSTQITGCLFPLIYSLMCVGLLVDVCVSFSESLAH